MTSRQETRSGRRWILVALLVFMLCLVLWIAAAFILNIAFAESLPFSLGLRSRLAANYSPDDFVGSLGIFRLSIIDEILLDRGMSPEEAEEQSKKIKEAMESPVPTATARDFEGNEPFTVTPEDQLTLTVSITPTETPTPTGTILVVNTATDTTIPPTETPAGPSKTPTFGPSPTPTKCLADPYIEILLPPDGAVYTLGDNLPAQAFAYDPDNVDPDTCSLIGVYPDDDGEGIYKVEFKIYWLDGGDKLVYSQDQYSAKYCGFTGTSTCYTVPVSSSTWPGGEPVSRGWHKLKARARDDGGNWSNWVWVEFYLDIPTPVTPTPSDTPTPTNTPTYTPFTPSSTPTPSDTPTPTPTFTPSRTPTDTPPSSDTTPPEIQPGWSVTPDFGFYPSCALSVSLFNLEVIDPFYSAGLTGAWLKYDVNNTGCYITVSPDSTSESCMSGICSGTYGWNFSVDLDNYESACSYTIPAISSISIKVWARAEDAVGLQDEELLGEYILDSGCAP
jgi:hypothetical protein